MPKSKRAREVPLTRVAKRTRKDRELLLARVQECAGRFARAYAVRAENMSNTNMQAVRAAFRDDGRLFLAKTSLMARALGTGPSDEPRPGIHALGRHVAGAGAGVLFANRPVAEVRARLAETETAGFARAGAGAPRSVTLSPGPLLRADDGSPVPPSNEPEMRRLGMPVRLVEGVVSLDPGVGRSDNDDDGDDKNDDTFTVCREGAEIDARQARLLRILGVRLACFRVRVVASWDAGTASVIEDDQQTASS